MSSSTFGPYSSTDVLLQPLPSPGQFPYLPLSTTAADPIEEPGQPSTIAITKVSQQALDEVGPLLAEIYKNEESALKERQYLEQLKFRRELPLRLSRYGETLRTDDGFALSSPAHLIIVYPNSSTDDVRMTINTAKNFAIKKLFKQAIESLLSIPNWHTNEEVTGLLKSYLSTHSGICEFYEYDELSRQYKMEANHL